MTCQPVAETRTTMHVFHGVSTVCDCRAWALPSRHESWGELRWRLPATHDA